MRLFLGATYVLINHQCLSNLKLFLGLNRNQDRNLIHIKPKTVIIFNGFQTSKSENQNKFKPFWFLVNYVSSFILIFNHADSFCKQFFNGSTELTLIWRRHRTISILTS